VSGPLAVALTADISAYERAMARAKDVAVRHSGDIAQAFVGAAGRIDKSFLSLANGPGMTALARLPAMAKTAVVGFLAFEAVSVALKVTDDAAKAAQERLEALVKIGSQAQGAGVGTTFFQSWTQQARDLHVEVRTLEGMLEHARQASTVKIGEADVAATSAMIDRLRQNVMAGNLGQSALDRFIGAKDQEQRIRVVLSLLDELKAKGDQLAAFDLAGKFFGAEFEKQLRNGTDMIGRMRQALDGLQVAGGDRIIPAEEIRRAEEINAQLNKARDIFANALRPLQEDMAQWQQAQLAGYADLVTMTANWAAGLGRVYEALRSVGDTITAIGNSSIFRTLNQWADKAGISGNWGGMGNFEFVDPDKPNVINVRPSGIAPAGDKSKALPSLRPAKATGGTAETDDDGVERYLRQLQRTNELLQAEVDTFGKSAKAREEALALIRAEAQAREDVARGKRESATLDADERTRILAAADATATLKDKLEGLRSAQQAWKDFGATLSDSFKEAVIEGRNLGDVLTSLVKKLEGKAIDALFNAVFSAGTGGTGAGAGLFAGLGKLLGFADGGEIKGPGTGKSDSILARVSNGEFVVNARATAANRALLEAINTGKLPAFATGGIVGAPSIPGAGFAPQAGSGQQVITIAPQVTVQATGGTPEHNADLAAQTARAVEGVVRSIVAKELRTQLRPGGLLS
jgi:hypothetical protein